MQSLGQLLELYPTRLMTSQPGRLPEAQDEDPVVTLAVRMAQAPVRALCRGRERGREERLPTFAGSGAAEECSWTSPAATPACPSPRPSRAPLTAPMQKLNLNGPGGYLRALFRVVHPSEAGLEAPWLPLDAYENRPDFVLEVGGGHWGRQGAWMVPPCP